MTGPQRLGIKFGHSLSHLAPDFFKRSDKLAARWTSRCSISKKRGDVYSAMLVYLRVIYHSVIQQKKPKQKDDNSLFLFFQHLLFDSTMLHQLRLVVEIPLSTRFQQHPNGGDRLGISATYRIVT